MQLKISFFYNNVNSLVPSSRKRPW